MFVRKGAMAAAVCAVVVGVASAYAQQIIQTIPPGSLFIAGRPFACGHRTTFIVQGLGQWAQIAPPNGIMLDQSLLIELPVVQMFTYAHECGHYQVGFDELAADCWSATNGKQTGWLSQADVNWLANYFSQLPSLPSHPSNIVRAQNILQCYTNA
jgi:hypothetical protein